MAQDSKICGAARKIELVGRLVALVVPDPGVILVDDHLFRGETGQDVYRSVR